MLDKCYFLVFSSVNWRIIRMKTANDLQIKQFRNKWRYSKLDLWNVHAKCNSKQNDGAWLKLWCGPKEYDANERSYKTDILHRYNGWIVNQLWGIHKQYSVILYVDRMATKMFISMHWKWSSKHWILCTEHWTEKMEKWK